MLNDLMKEQLCSFKVVEGLSKRINAEGVKISQIPRSLPVRVDLLSS